MLMTKKNLIKIWLYSTVILSFATIDLKADHPDNSQENSAYADASNLNNYPSQGYTYLPLGGVAPNPSQSSCQGGACRAQTQGQQSQGQCQNGSCSVGNSQQQRYYQGGCQNGQCYRDHYGTHYGEQNGWHYPRPDCTSCNGNNSCNGNSCNGNSCNVNGYNGQYGDNSSYVQNCQSGACNVAHRPDQYNVNYNNYPYDCSYDHYTYPYDGSYYYSVHPWLDGF